MGLTWPTTIPCWKHRFSSDHWS